MRVFVIDTETTGLSHETDAVCEIGLCEVTMGTDEVWKPECATSSFVNPGCPIPPEASGIHDITDEMVASAPLLAGALGHLIPADARPVAEKGVVFVAHNAPFDQGFLPMLSKARWIDTLRCALHIWPDAPGHSNNTLRYYRDVAKPWFGGSQDGRLRHSAAFDTAVTAAILCDMLKDYTVTELVEMTKKPAILKKIRFGEHFGKTWPEIPDSYLGWMTRKGGFDENTTHTVNHEIMMRKARPKVTSHGS